MTHGTEDRVAIGFEVQRVGASLALAFEHLSVFQMLSANRSGQKDVLVVDGEFLAFFDAFAGPEIMSEAFRTLHNAPPRVGNTIVRAHAH